MSNPTPQLITRELRLVCGIGPAVGDSLSAEAPLRVLDLLNTRVSGFALEPFGWTPGLPQLKSGGQWGDSALSDGRTLVSEAVGNVVETMRLTSEAATLPGRRSLERSLLEFARLARAFWTTDSQIEPVYLQWWAAEANGRQYALIYNINVAQSGDPYGLADYQQMTLSIEREPYWRGVRPGGNPKEWTYEKRGFVPGRDYNVDNLDLLSGSDHLYVATVANKHEWSPASAGQQINPITRNYLEIAAADVPGDAPALVELSVVSSGETYAELYVARSSKPTSTIDHGGVQRANAYILNAGDAGGTGKSVGTSANGARSNGSATSYYYVERTLSGAATSDVATWGLGVSGNLLELDRNLLRGKFAAFLRARINPGDGADGDMLARLRVEEIESATNQIVQSVSLPQVTLLAGATYYPLAYLGQVEIPLSGRAVQSTRGYGLQIRQGIGNLRLVIEVENVNASARTVQMVDLVLMPIDEAMVAVHLPLASYAFVPTTALFDNTGYLTRGPAEPAATAFVTEALSGGTSVEVTGQDLTLLPGVAQRLYFLFSTYTIYPIGYSDPSDTLTVRLNIIPRWSGVRDDRPLLPNPVSGMALVDGDDSYLLDEDLSILEDG